METGTQQLVLIAGGVQQSSAYCLAVAYILTCRID